MFTEAVSSNAGKDEQFSVLREVSLVTQAGLHWLVPSLSPCSAGRGRSLV